jgi:hypothetical protein
MLESRSFFVRYRRNYVLNDCLLVIKCIFLRPPYYERNSTKNIFSIFSEAYNFFCQHLSHNLGKHKSLIMICTTTKYFLCSCTGLHRLRIIVFVLGVVIFVKNKNLQVIVNIYRIYQHMLFGLK